MVAARAFSVRRRLLLLLSAPLGLLLAAGVLIDYYSTASPLHAAYDQVLASSIVAVGAAHLAGQDSVVSMLAKRRHPAVRVAN